MTTPCLLAGIVRSRRGRHASLAVLAVFAALANDVPARAQEVSPLERVRSLGLETVQVGRVTVHFAAADRGRAQHLGALADEAASYYATVYRAGFPLHLAVLGPAHWFDPYVPGGPPPYGSPWGWIPDLLMAVPASLDEGVLIRGPDESANARRVEFVMLHEFGHLASKRYLHPGSARLYSSVRWFEEFLATYFAYGFWEGRYPGRAAAGRAEWAEFAGGFTPPVVSLDWTFMQRLSPEEFGQTYAWYQFVLNLHAATIFREHGLDFLREVRDRLPWDASADWTTASVVAAVTEFAPGFGPWAEALRKGEYRARP